jgi:signal transduction histidine kinase/CheY-like chemotaxis protein
MNRQHSANSNAATANTAAGVDYDTRVLAAKIEILTKQWVIIGIVHLTVASITAVILWGHFPTARVMGWYGAALLLTLLRISLIHRLGPIANNIAGARTHAFAYLVVAGMSGLLWGLLAVLFIDPEKITLSAFIVCILVGMVAGALPSMAALVPVFYAFSTPLFLLLTVKMALFTTGAELNWLVVLIVAFWLANSLFARNLQHTITNSITTDLHNVQLLAEITSAKEQAEQANIAKSRFLAAASHDLRQPLHAMGLFIDTLRDRLDSEADIKLFENITSAHAALEHLFSALLEISRLDSGAVKPQISHFQLRPLLQDLCQEFAAEASQKGVALALKGQDSVVQSDLVLLNRIVRNLISNAVHYTREGEVSVNVEAFDQRVKILVEDSGIGIPENELDNIFSEYHQLHNVERDRRKGLGLGLAVVRRMADLLGYTVAVRSELGRGSVFSIEVPTGDPRLVARETEPTVTQSLTGKRVFVVDDEKPILEGMRLLLEKWGCQVTTAESSIEAIAGLRSRNWQADILIADYRLRGGDTGMKMIEAIRRDCPHEIPALLISGDTDRELLRTIRKRGYYLLHKPIKSPHLHKAMCDLLCARAAS